MKKITAICSAAMVLSLLSGCSDATASLKNGSDTLMKVGKTAITKQQVYNIMYNYAGSTQVVSDATKVITSQEVEVTDEMKESAQSTLDMYKTIYSDSFTDYLEDAGLTEDDYINDYLIPSLQAEKLTDLYIDESYDTLLERYKPVKATILKFTDTENANSALAALRDGTMTAEEAANEFETDSTGQPEIITIDNTEYDSVALAALRAASPDDGWMNVSASYGTDIYVMHMDENNTDSIKDEIVEAFAEISDINDQATAFYFEKYGFHVYDIDLYKALRDSNPTLLTQEVPVSAE